MDILMLALRVVHIGAGIFWGGAALMMNYFWGPTVRATGLAGQQFAGHLMLKTKFVNVMTAMATLTILSGAGLFWVASNGLNSAWLKSGMGIGFALGGLFGLVGYISGAIFGRLNLNLTRLGSQIKGKPTPGQLAEIQSLQKRVALSARVSIPCIILSILLMAVARYLFLLNNQVNFTPI
ncbi:MAG: hypothetical protein HFACDABA_00705 [Anaerolineales bacterium]|nr:hypothetical protein [Anaerolineales bacterium]